MPLPAALTRAQLFLAECGDVEISAFWGTQIVRLEELVLSSAQIEATWAAQIPTEILPAAGKIRAIPFLSLMGQANLGGRRWVKQFISGIALVGELSQRHKYPASRKEVIPLTAVWPIRRQLRAFSLAGSKIRRRKRIAALGRISTPSKNWLADRPLQAFPRGPILRPVSP